MKTPKLIDASAEDAEIVGVETSAPQAARQTAVPPRPRRSDQEFLPAALEILESPPSPVRIALIWIITAIVVTALLWTWFGRFDVVAIAQGKIQPPGRVKLVQAIETGKVVAIHARNGDAVKAGDILVEFDPADARADVEGLAAVVAAHEAEIARRSAAIAAAFSPDTLRRDMSVTWPSGIPESVRIREQWVLAADLAQLAATLENIAAQTSLKTRERERLSATVEAQTVLVTTLRERVAMRATLAATGSGSRASVIDGQEALQKEETLLATQRGQLAEAEASINVLVSDRERQIRNFLADNSQKRAEAARNLEDIAQRLIKARVRLDNLKIRSPADGIVQASTVYTIGQVVGAGHEVLRVVPAGTSLEVEAYVPNKDIGFIEVGQHVAVKVEAFPYTRYGMLSGRVTHIALDALPQMEASQVESLPARASETPMFAGAQRLQNLVFPITIALEKTELPAGGRLAPLSPGMSVSAEIKTGSRRILEYLMSPILETAAEAMRER
jgi:hemolysin D